ncbi:uncharacterized protein LOC111051232 isoform X1 [Nilaparvata lugens]|uniref:uncharacterized protein LOC111051232 isoform X1 n=1 Tax=Nilaparvata lugens TaxID=108931 RepID=UPI00193E2CB1|nr:uncharacterized protein LOC111051232 isoform X1 [Nilaparvata lugens]
MTEISDVNPLPPGWDAKYDSRTGRRYFINYFTRNTSLDDPRANQKQNEYIPMQDFSRPSGMMGRTIGPPTMGAPALQYQQQKNAAAETTLEQSVAKISAMFPTVGETHIKTLLIKYHNREAVVMSALQVEHHPVTMPGPYTPPMGARGVSWGPTVPRGTPPLTPRASPRANMLRSSSPFRNTSSPPRPPHSPKMKLRYLKSVFPVVEETLLLDTLCNSDNNVHRASEQLMTMGFNKRDTPPPRVSLKRGDSPPRSAPATNTPPPPPRMRSVEEKQSMKERLHKKNPDIPERVVSIALDSVDYDEEKAAQILDMMQEDDKKRTETTLKIISEPKDEEVKAVPIDMPHIPVQLTSASATNEAIPPKSIQTANNNNHRRCKGKKESPKMNKEFSPSENKYHSQLLSKPCGANPTLTNGPNNDILLPDYATWTGPNQELAQGPDRTLLGANSRVKPRGPDLSLRKGPIKGLAKGSIYSRLVSSTNAANTQKEAKTK